MKKLFALSVSGAMFLFVIASSCNKDNNDSPSVVQPYTPTLSTSLSGLGSHGGYPSGTPYVLPFHIKLIGSMYGGSPPGYSNYFDGTKNLKNIDEHQSSSPKINYNEYGIGTYVNVYMKLYNNSNSQYKLIVPGGLIMSDSTHGDTSSTDTTQSGLVIVEDTIHFPPYDTVGVCLKSFCLNLHHSVPYGNKYTFSVISNNDQLYKMTSILRGKSSLEEHVSDIQSYIWKITDGTGLTQEDIDIMTSWP